MGRPLRRRRQRQYLFCQPAPRACAGSASTRGHLLSPQAGSRTPLETCQALALMVRQGKALYVGLSTTRPRLPPRRRPGWRNSAPAWSTSSSTLFQRDIEADTLPVCRGAGDGGGRLLALAGGLLSDRYLAGIPADSRAASASPFLKPEQITPDGLARIRALHDLAQRRGQSLSQLALRWVLRGPVVSCALIGASSLQQITSAVDALAYRPWNAAAADPVRAGVTGLCR